MVKFLLVMLFFLITCAADESSIEESNTPALADGLSWTFYNESCPNVEAIVKSTFESLVDVNVTQAPGVLRLLFHDCFVQGCDASVLINETGSELEDIPNLTLSAGAVYIIKEIKLAVEAACPQVVSCADILALAGCYSVQMAGGPEIPVPLGRRDSLSFANESVVSENIPDPTSDLTVLASLFAAKGFNITELVVLAGGHTFGVAHCESFVNRIYPTTDSSLDPMYAEGLYLTCPTYSYVNDTVLDIRTPSVFDNMFYVNLENGEVLFTSDEVLYDNSSTRETVTSLAGNESLFFEMFVAAMVKMIQIDVLTGSEGEVRKVCSAASSNSTYSIIDSQDLFSSSQRSV